MIKNLSTNYVLKLILLVSELLLLPVYIRVLGVEQFGIYSLYISFAIWISVFDLGMSQTLQREISKSKNESEEISNLIKTIEIIAVFISCVILLLSVLGFDYVLNMKNGQLTYINNYIVISILIGLMLATKVYENIYKNAFIGSDKQIHLNVILVLIQSLKICVAVV